MSSAVEVKTDAKQKGGFSGPHVCVQVGMDTMSAVRAALLEACDGEGGHLDARGIERVFDLLGSLPEVYGIYQRGFNHCAHLHENPVLNLSDPLALGRYLIQAYCRDVATAVFPRQIKQFGPRWFGRFVEGLQVYLLTLNDGRLSDALQDRYRVLAQQKGSDLSLGGLLTDPGILDIVAAAVTVLQHTTTDDHRKMEAAINTHIAEAYSLSGPSIAKINDTLMEQFLERLWMSSDGSPFRAAVNARIPH